MIIHEYEHEERSLAKIRRECSFGLTALIGGGIAAALGGGAAATTIGSIAAPAVLGAGAAALTGGKVGKGALLGGLGGLAGTALGLGSARMGAGGDWIPGAQGFPDTGALGSAASGPGFDPLSIGVDDWTQSPQKGGFAGGIGQALGVAGKDFDWKKGIGGLLMGALSQATSGRPDYGVTPGPETTAGTRGPYFDKGLSGDYVKRQPVQSYRPANGDWYTYGQTPNQAPFFTDNQLHLGMARGGALSTARRGQAMPRPASFDSGRGDRYVQGPGDGQQDMVDAKLSAGEYVFDAATVSRIGNGSNDAGARKLDQMRRRIARDTTGNGRVVPRRAKAPESYIATGRGR